MKNLILLLIDVPKLIAQLGQEPVLRNPIAVSLGAIAGALSRYYLNLWIGQLLGTSFPYGTLLVNFSGCVAMGFFFTLVTERILTIPPEAQILIAVGFLGSYTTFSSYALDTSALWHAGDRSMAIGYGLGSATLGLMGLEIGSWLAKRLF
jgi:fluoride exporter